MTKRGSDAEMEGPAAKMRAEEDDNGGGRTGRIRKKSAKVLEMEEFEQVEKVQHVTKKTKGVKATPMKLPGEMPGAGEAKTPGTSSKKVKLTVKAPPPNLMQEPITVTPVSSKTQKMVKPSQLLAPGILTTADLLAAAAIQDDADNPISYQTETVETVQTISSANTPAHPDKMLEDQRSVIKYLLNSPTSGTKSHPSPGSGTPKGSSKGSAGDSSVLKKSAKKALKSLEKEKLGSPTIKGKAKKIKTPGISQAVDADDILTEDPNQTNNGGLKIKIFSSSDPASAQVSLNPKGDADHGPSIKIKKLAKKVKLKTTDEETPSLKKSKKDATTDLKKAAKKASKEKKELLIQEAIIAAKQKPILSGQGSDEESSSPAQKPKKKKQKKMSLSGESPGESPKIETSMDDDESESNLVIAETEKKKKPKLSPKKKSSKEKTESPKGEDPSKKLSKRAPTAYMLFCNTHRPTIVDENPGIEFAAISRKLGELWQGLSSKQKLQWRRKAQRRNKKGSNLISTGKGGKDTQPGGIVPQVTAPGPSQTSAVQQVIRLPTVVQKVPLESPTSPTKQNFSIEPIDVAAHLKLLGESLSIIGMRLQEHKGMIAVQGSLSVLLDSLLCACGPLLCLTQQVPGMDGCSPLVHSHTLDSISYIMPGL